MENSFTKIEEGLCLGGKEAFLEAREGNSHGFTTIITAAPLLAIDEKASAGEVGEHFEKKGITWLYPGKMLADNPRYWPALVYDCTFSDELSRIEFSFDLSESSMQEICSQKAEKISKIPAAEWFEPTFQMIDEGIARGRVLIHCEWGRSRSAAILAAYLIKRKGMSCEEALAYLSGKRPEVDSKFREELKSYEEALKI